MMSTLTCLAPEFPVVFDWNISALFKFQTVILSNGMRQTFEIIHHDECMWDNTRDLKQKVSKSDWQLCWMQVNEVFVLFGSLTTVSSLPDAFLNALVHLVFLGLRFFLKFLWHLDLQNWKAYKHTHTCQNSTPDTK